MHDRYGGLRRNALDGPSDIFVEHQIAHHQYRDLGAATENCQPGIQTVFGEQVRHRAIDASAAESSTWASECKQSSCTSCIRATESVGTRRQMSAYCLN